MEYKLTQQLIDLAKSQGILDLITWGDSISSKAYLDRQLKLGVSIPKAILDYYNSPPVASLEWPANKAPELYFDLATTQYYFIEPRTGLKLSQALFESGFGINSKNVEPGNYMKRFNGMSLDNKAAMARPYPILITELGCTSDETNTGAYYDCITYNMAGEDERIIGRLTYTMQNTQMGAAWLDVMALIPAYRRITMRVGGARVSQPQGWYKYRQIIE